MQSKHPIGEKVAALRSLKNMEPIMLATRSGLSVSQLNLIESGLSITVAYGTDIFELHKGDSIYLDSIVEHQVTTPGPKARILGVIYVPV